MTGATIRRTLAIGTLALGLALVAAPAAAQSGQVKGKVVDAKGQPIDGAKVTIANVETSGRKLETKTNKKGEYIQIGLQPGRYTITVEKGDLKDSKEVQIHLDMAELNFTLAPGQGTMSKEDQAKVQAKNAAIQKAFSEGVELSNQNKNEEAIAKFQEVLVSVPKCAECYANIGTIQARMKDYEKAEASFKQAIEVKPDFVEAYNGLASVYNAEKKFDLANQASEQATKYSAGAAGTAGTGGNASAIYNQGVIFWNQNKAQEAAERFEAAVKADPNFAEAHYMLGKANINLGKLPEAAKELQEYLRISPNGPNKDDAQKTLEYLKPYIK
jgi:tetratricopeptide (TPR) repeat protein